MSRARFLIDECLSVELAALAWKRGYQASHLRDLGLLRSKDGQLARIIFKGDWCFVTQNARDFRGPDDAMGSSGEYADVDLHAGLVCIHGPPQGFTKTEQLGAFTVALDLIERHGGDYGGRARRCPAFFVRLGRGGIREGYPALRDTRVSLSGNARA